MRIITRFTGLIFLLFLSANRAPAQGCRFVGRFATPTTATTLFLNGEEINQQISIGPDGRFQDTIAFEKPTWILAHTENSYSWLIWLDSGTINVVFKEKILDDKPGGKRLLSVDRIDGPFDTEAREWLVQRYNSLWKEYGNKDSLSVYLREDVESFIKARPSSLLLPQLLRDMGSMLTPAHSEALIRFAAEHTTAPTNEAAWNTIHRQIGRAKLLKAGAAFPAFSMPGVDGKSYNLSSLDADYILVHFWASWCAPCRVQSPGLKALFDSTDRRRVQIVHISLDEDRKAWRKAITQDQSPGLHLSELNGWNNTLAQKLLVDSVPFMVLLNRSRQVVAVSTSVSQVRAIITGDLMAGKSP